MNLNVADFEEIINLQRQGRRLSNMQMQSLNEFVQRRLSMSNTSNHFGAQQQHVPSHSTSSSQYPMFYSRGNGIPFEPSPQQMMQYSSSSGFGTNEQSYGRPFTPELFRRDSLGFAHNVLDEFGYNPNGSERRTSMEKRNSLDLLGDAAVALSGNGDMSNSTHTAQPSSMDPSNNRNYIAPNTALPQNTRRSSLDFFLGGVGDPIFGRRNSLTQFLIQEFANPSRRSSMLSTVALNKPLDSFYLENLFDDPSNYTSGIHFPSTPTNTSTAANYQSSSSNSDLFGMQLVHPSSHRESTAIIHNNIHKNNMDSAGDYLFLQNLQNSLRRQSWCSTLNDFSTVQHLHTNTSKGSSEMNPIMEKSGHWQKSKKKDVRTKHSETETDLQVDPNDLPPFTLERMYSFKASMEKSIQTQTDIQMWDKKMGLKRSHSATMTQTTRSRKKLRKMLEKHLDILTKVNMESTAKARKQQKSGQ